MRKRILFTRERDVPCVISMKFFGNFLYLLKTNICKAYNVCIVTNPSLVFIANYYVIPLNSAVSHRVANTNYTFKTSSSISRKKIIEIKRSSTPITKEKFLFWKSLYTSKSSCCCYQIALEINRCCWRSSRDGRCRALVSLHLRRLRPNTKHVKSLSLFFTTLITLTQIFIKLALW